MLEPVSFGLLHGQNLKWNNKEAYRLGYKPKDNAEKFSKNKLTKNEHKDKIALRLHGGVFTTDGLKGKLKDILNNN